jgi:cell wall-associated NlpC family hydrolase
MRAVSTRVIALGAAVVVAMGLGPQAWADEDDPVIPSKDDVAAAEQRVADAERSVQDIQAELFAASDRLEELGIAAQVAAERYNGAILAWEQARADLRDARDRAHRATKRAEAIRSALAGFVVADHTATSELTSFSTALGEGPAELLDEYAEYAASAGALDNRFQEWQASSELAKVYAADAADALQTAHDAKADAEDARVAAEEAVRVQESAVVTIGEQRDVLINELAQAQDISVALATQRQEGLEQRRAERRAEQRRQELLAQQRQEQRQQARLEREQARQARLEREQAREDRFAREQARQDRLDQRRTERQEQRAEDRRERREERREQRQDQPDPPPPPPPPPPPAPPEQSGNARDAVAFAYDQLGEPYVWGAAGPDSWDCSGLTMGAWQAAGVYLPHYSVSQYYATTPVSYGSLRPGDLIFWATNSSDPGTIFHVGLYIGGGQMIHAPRTGKDVEIQDVWYWESPDFFGRP